MGDIRIDSTTNSEAEIREALGVDKAPAAEAATEDTPKTTTGESEPATEGEGGEASPAEAPPESPATDEEPGDEPEGEGEGEDDEDEEPSKEDASEAGRTLAKKSKASGRIKKLLGEKDAILREKYQSEAEKNIAQARVRDLEAEIAELRKTATPKTETPAESTAPAAVDDPEPKEDDFPTWPEYDKARREWDRRQILKEANATVESKLAEVRQREQATAHQAKLKQTWDEVATQYEDFSEAMQASANVPANAAMRARLADVENNPIGAHIAYYLAKNPTVCERIARMDGGMSLVELGKLEARFEAGILWEGQPKPSDKTAPKKPAASATPAPGGKKVPVSKAPAPISRVKSSAATSSTKPDDMSFTDYKAFRQKRKTG